MKLALIGFALYAVSQVYGGLAAADNIENAQASRHAQIERALNDAQ